MVEKYDPKRHIPCIYVLMVTGLRKEFRDLQLEAFDSFGFYDGIAGNLWHM